MLDRSLWSNPIKYNFKSLIPDFNMNIKDRIDYINSLKLDERINHRQELILLANKYLFSEECNDKQSLELIRCLSELRTSRFIQSDMI